MTRMLRDTFRITNVWADAGVIMIRLVSQPAGPNSRVIEMPYSLAEAERLIAKLDQWVTEARFQTLYDDSVEVPDSVSRV